MDGNPGTFWHSRWSTGSDPFPHYVVIDLGEERELGSFTYVPRQADANPRNGQIRDYELLAATAGTFVPPTDAQLTESHAHPEPSDAQWKRISQGQWQISTSDASTVTFAEPITARYLKLVSTGGFSDSGGQFTNAGELRVAAPAVSAPEELEDPELGPSPSPSPTEDPTEEPSPDPTTKPTTPTSTPSTTKPPASTGSVYDTPGHHDVGGRKWFTQCEPYSQTQRCRTEIWATVISYSDGAYSHDTGWHFNNLTYLPQMTREAWGSNPLANSDSFTSDGRAWYTECDTAATGRGGCRSYIWTHVIGSTPAPGGGYTYHRPYDWVFNNQVKFSN